MLAWIAVLVAAQPASAATVQRTDTPGDSDPRGPGPATAITLRAGAGEANRLTLTVSDDEVRFADVVPLEPEPGCEARGPHRVVCPVGGRGVSVQVHADLGDGDDTASLSNFRGGGSSVNVSLGAGDDRASLGGSGVGVGGGPGDDQMTGGPGADRLAGGNGVDELDGEGGDDVLYGSPAEEASARPDRLDGGAGRDRTQIPSELPVLIDLRGGETRSGAARDELVSIEDATGGSGADRLLGDDRPNRLHGDGGTDLLDGRGGGDVLDGGFGLDFLHGGPGADILNPLREDDLNGTEAVEPGGDSLACGAGADRIEVPRERDVVDQTCDHLPVVSQYGYATAAESLRLVGDLRRPAAAHLALPRRCGESSRPCRGTLTVHVARPGRRLRTGELLLRRTFLRPARERGPRRTARLGRETRALLLRREVERVVVTLREPGERRRELRQVVRLEPFPERTGP